ncbi:ABC transporter substrate-binding protein [Alkalihalobacillus deserti]|uniref:ABC transporter substrate-binding protein n=1 Tax=Alkalihalobacillus deserti TaxID=2879466 RepID=UPI001D13E851|nr:ABC transporter substrate-binding protein [Alkalihalobacillus deserti]
MKGKQITIVFFFIMSIMFVLAACSNDSSTEVVEERQENIDETVKEVSEEDKYGGSVKIRIAQQPRSFGYPLAIANNPTPSLPVAQPALETLGRYNLDGTVGPWLAKEWEMDPDAKTVTVYLEEGIKFHDGTDFNAEAVKWVFDEVIKTQPSLTVIGSVEIIDDHTLVFHFDEWVSGAHINMFTVVPIGSPTAYEELGEEGNWNHPVGTGPFKFESMENNDYIKFVRNEDYWKEGLPYLDSLEFKIIANETTAKNAFLAKEVDVALMLGADTISEFEGSSDFKVVHPSTNSGLVGIGMIPNTSDPNSPLSDVRVRKAITYAIDREQIAETVFRGYATTSNQFTLPGEWSYNPDLDPFEYNPEKAKQLLAEAGYPDGFKTKITTQNQRNFLMQAVQGYLAEVGIEVEVDVVEQTRLMSMIYEEGWEGFTEFIYTTAGDELGTLMRPFFGPDPVLWGNITELPDDVVDLIVAFDTELEEGAREKLAHELQSTVMEEHHMITPFFISRVPYLRQNNVHDDGYWTLRSDYFTPEKLWVEK